MDRAACFMHWLNYRGVCISLLDVAARSSLVVLPVVCNVLFICVFIFAIYLFCLPPIRLKCSQTHVHNGAHDDGSQEKTA